MATATTGTVSGPAASPTPGLRPYRITVDVYERIAASGAFGDKSGVFLWKGQLVEKVSDMTKGRPHVLAVNELDRLLGDLVRGAGYFVEQDQPIALGNDSEPEPDLKCVRGTTRDYTERTPTAHDCPLLVEVADSSLDDDTGEVLRAYASAVVPVYWVVNIPERRIDVYSRPSGPAASPTYEEQRSYGPDDEVPVILDGREVGRIPVREVLP
jgi:Uma2 family endonuclease